MPGAQPCDLAFAIDAHVDNEIATSHERYFCVFLMHGVAIENSAVRAWIFEELRTVPHLDRIEPGNAGADQLSATGIASHQVWLNESGGDFQVRPGVAVVDPYGNTAFGRAEVIVLIAFLAMVVEAAIVAGNFRAHQFIEFGALIGAM